MGKSLKNYGQKLTKGKSLKIYGQKFLPGPHTLQLLNGAVLILDELAADAHERVTVSLQEHAGQDVANLSDGKTAAGRDSLLHGGVVPLMQG